MNLKEIKTCDLVNELRTREGVSVKTPARTKSTALRYGPAVILVVVD
jgi:hypothetical protein